MMQGILLIDAQERLMTHIEGRGALQGVLKKLVRAAQIFNYPLVATEQEKLGPSVLGVPTFKKHTFDCTQTPEIATALEPIETWVVVGVEAHICVWQTAKALVTMGKRVITLNDGIGSRSIYNYSTAIAAMRDCGVEISCLEMWLFEQLGSSKSPHFDAILSLVKEPIACCGCC